MQLRGRVGVIEDRTGTVATTILTFVAFGATIGNSSLTTKMSPGDMGNWSTGVQAITSPTIIDLPGEATARADYPGGDSVGRGKGVVKGNE